MLAELLPPTPNADIAMKKLTLTLSFLALSTLLFAQSAPNLDNSFAASETNATANGMTTATAFGAIYGTDNETAYVALQSETTTAEQIDYNGKPPYKRNSFNKGYTIGNAVSYGTGIGLRLGGIESGLTVKHLIENNTAIEVILSSGWQYKGTRLTALYEIEKPVGTEGFYWFWGAGVHAGLYNGRYWNNGDCKDGRYESGGQWWGCNDSRTTFGIAGIVGIEYHFIEVPLSIGVDTKPTFDILGRSRHYGDAAFSVRYTF